MLEPLPRGRNPFDETGVERDADGRAHYVDRPASLVEMLRASVERDAAATAVLEVGGPSLSYGELWERAARVAGGLRGAGVERGERVAIRLANGIDWVLAFFGAQMLGAVVVPVNTRFTEEEVAYVVEDSGASYTFAPGDAAPRGRAGRGRRPRPRRPGGDLLHERHDRLSQGRDDLARQLPHEQRERASAAWRSIARRARRSRRWSRCRCSTSPAATAS